MLVVGVDLGFGGLLLGIVGVGLVSLGLAIIGLWSLVGVGIGGGFGVSLVADFVAVLSGLARSLASQPVSAPARAVIAISGSTVRFS